MAQGQTVLAVLAEALRLLAVVAVPGAVRVVILLMRQMVLMRAYTEAVNRATHALETMVLEQSVLWPLVIRGNFRLLV